MSSDKPEDLVNGLNERLKNDNDQMNNSLAEQQERAAEQQKKIDDLKPKVDEMVSETAPSEVNQESNVVTIAREKFRAKVQSFVEALNEHDSQISKDPNANGPYQILQGFVDNAALPKRKQEREIIGAMTQLAAHLQKKQLAEGVAADKLKEMEQKFQGLIEETKTAEQEYDSAEDNDQKQKRTPITPGFVEGNPNLYQYNKTEQGEKTFGVMSTDNTIEGFKKALEHYANSQDENGNPRKYGNVTFGRPAVSAQQLKESAGLKDNFHERVLAALDAGLYPEREIEKLVEALTGPSLNSRAHFLTSGKEDRLKAQQLQELRDKIDDYKNDRDGKPRKDASVQASVNPANQNRIDQSANKENEQAATLTMKK
ncbi:MAG: hypothetical protein SFW07_00415 [Gammaproteobacteria bacterium]|nr:hypothetical protein [Gammaproteobacteria bacterium]